MNNGYSGSSNDNIGIDPTTINTIDTLDDSLFVPTNPNNDNKKTPKEKLIDLIKKIFFVIVILAIMGGISFGLYYYLSLGNKNKGNGNNAPTFVLNDVEVVVDTPLSSNILDYGDFSSLDLTDCTINTQGVDNTKVGEYDYYVLCDSTKYTAKIKVIDEPRFIINTKLVTKQVGETTYVKDFIETKENYAFVYVDEVEVNNYLKTPGGPYLINIKAVNEDNHEEFVTAVLIVISENPKFYLTCKSPSMIYDNNESIKFIQIDKLAFNATNENMNVSIRNYEYTFTEYQAYNNAKKTIVDGKITLGDVEGYAVFSDETMTINNIVTLKKETLDKEYGSTFPTSYGDINNYYKTTKKYTCSI